MSLCFVFRNSEIQFWLEQFKEVESLLSILYPTRAEAEDLETSKNLA